MAERVDVCIVGRASAARSPPGGSRSCTRRRGSTRRASSCSSAAAVTSTPSSGSRCRSSNLAGIYELIQSTGGSGAQVWSRTPWAAAPTSTSPRPCARPARPSSGATTTPTTAPTGACGPRRSHARTLDPYYARAEAGLRVSRPSWDQVSKSGGLWAATLAAAGHSCDRVPLAIDCGALRERQVVPHRLHLRREEHGDHQLPRLRRAGGRPRAAEPPGGARCAARCRTRPATATWSAPR